MITMRRTGTIGRILSPEEKFYLRQSGYVLATAANRWRRGLMKFSKDRDYASPRACGAHGGLRRIASELYSGYDTGPLLHRLAGARTGTLRTFLKRIDDELGRIVKELSPPHRSRSAPKATSGTTVL
jgi:hypothetical protein